MPENTTLDPMYSIVFWFVMAGWFVFAIAFLLRKRPPATAMRVRNNRSVWGVMLMGVGMALVWWIRRPAGLAFVPGSLTATYLLDFLACFLTACSIWLIVRFPGSPLAEIRVGYRSSRANSPST